MSKLSYTLSKGMNDQIQAISNQYGYIRMDTVEEADAAVKGLDGNQVGGQTIVV